VTPTIEPEVLHFESDGITLTGERWDAGGDGAAVVLLHGGGQTRHSWKRTAQRLAQGGRTAIALDARGHGDSAWHPTQDYSSDGFIGDLVRFVSTLARPPVLVGASLGGITALAATGENPGLAAALVLVDIVVTLEPQGVARIREFMTGRPEGFASLEEVADAIAAYNPHRPRPTNLDGLRKNVRRHDDGRWYWHWDPAFLLRGDEPSRDERVERMIDFARAIAVPTLLVRGKQSDIVTEEGVAELRALIPHAELADVSDAGHMVAGDDNDVFTASLIDFLIGVAAGRKS
jgi:pimeloyl-ACP methyl ester carboxylesterase